MSDTLGYYDANAADYAERMLPEASGLRELAVFCGRLPAGANVLDLGCGAGHFAAIMLEAGLDVDLLDGSSGLAAQAMARTGREVTIRRYQELDSHAAYDGIWASASLLHAAQVELPDIFSRIAAALRPGGYFYCSFKALDSDLIDALNRHYVRMSPERLDALLRDAGFEPCNLWRSPSKGADGKSVEMIAALARILS